MLKGEEYLNHIKCIIRRFKNAGIEIEESGLKHPAPPEEPEAPQFPFVSEDNGDGILEADDGDSDEVETPVPIILPSRPGARGPRTTYAGPASYRNRPYMTHQPTRKLEPLEPELDALLAVDDDSSSDEDGDTKMEDFKLSYRRAGAGGIAARPIPSAMRLRTRSQQAQATKEKTSEPNTLNDSTSQPPLLS